MCISLRPYNFFMRSNVNLGSFGVTGVKRTFSAKMLLLLQNTWCYLYVTQCIYGAHKYALTWDSLLHSMGQGQITSSGRVRHLWWQMCLVFFFFFCCCGTRYSSCTNESQHDNLPVPFFNRLGTGEEQCGVRVLLKDLTQWARVMARTHNLVIMSPTL